MTQPTEPIEDRIENLMRIAEQAEGIKGYGVTPAFHMAVKNLLLEAQISELTKVPFSTHHTDKVRDYVIDRIASLQKELKNGK